MTVLTVTATERYEPTGGSTGFGGGGVKSRVATTELAAADSASTVTFFRIPSNARILGASKLYNDDLATSGSPTLDLGLFPTYTGQFTADDDALHTGVALSTASTANSGMQIVTDYANLGKRAWEYISGQTADPKGELIVKGTVRAAATTATGTITLELLYEVD